MNINKLLLNPILKVQDKGLTPLIFNERIIKEIANNEYILSRFPESNFVKLWLINKLNEDELIINAKIDEKLLLKTPLLAISDFNKTRKDFIKDKKLNLLYTGCYIIIFNEFYYIGSSINLKDRLRGHYNNVNRYRKKENNELSTNFKNILDSIEKLESKDHILYLNTNYLNLFINEYPSYKLNKAEYLLLSKVTDLLIKILEVSLILKYEPKLNTYKEVSFKHFQWKDEYFNIYNNKLTNNLKVTKYEIKILNKKVLLIENLLNYFNIDNNYKRLIYYNKLNNLISVRTSTLQDICQRYYLNVNEVVNNLNKFHYYKNTLLRNPLKIIEIKT